MFIRKLSRQLNRVIVSSDTDNIFPAFRNLHRDKKYFFPSLWSWQIRSVWDWYLGNVAS